MLYAWIQNVLRNVNESSNVFEASTNLANETMHGNRDRKTVD